MAPRLGAEQLLRLGPFQWFGKRSYSLYLWHWPILIIAAEQAGKSTLPLRENLLLILLAIVISMASYRLVENPIRHWKLPSRTTVAAGIALVVTTVLVLSLVIGVESTPEAVTDLVARTQCPRRPQRGRGGQVDHTRFPPRYNPAWPRRPLTTAASTSTFLRGRSRLSRREKLCFLGDVHARGSSSSTGTRTRSCGCLPSSPLRKTHT